MAFGSGWDAQYKHPTATIKAAAVKMDLKNLCEEWAIGDEFL
jgi:hypothetical protein